MDLFLNGVKLVGAILAILAAVIGPIVYYNHRLSYLEAVDRAQEWKINTIWTWFVRAAKSDAADKGVVTVNSPMKISDKSRPLYNNMISALREIYRQEFRKKGKEPSEVELSMIIANQLKEELWDEVCNQTGMNHGECLIGAVALAQEVGRQSLGFN